MAYRNELAAAQNRGNALEREVGALRQQLSEHGVGTENRAWSRLMDRGASEQDRFLQAANRKREKSAAASEKAKAAKRRGKRRAAQFRRFDERRRYIRSTSRVGWCAHWMFPVIAMTPFLCVFPLYIAIPWTLWILLASFSACLGVWGLCNLWALFRASREDARLEALPFQVCGHHELLESNLKNLNMTLSFEGSAPTAVQMRRWNYGLATETRGRALRTTIRHTMIASKDHAIVATPKGMATAWMAGNRSYYVWYRRVVEKALVELHEAFPLTRVTMGSFK